MGLRIATALCAVHILCACLGAQAKGPYPPILDGVSNSPSWSVMRALKGEPGAHVVFTADCLAWQVVDILGDLEECSELARAVAMEEFWSLAAAELRDPADASARELARIVTTLLISRPLRSPDGEWRDEARHLTEGEAFRSKLFAVGQEGVEFAANANSRRKDYASPMSVAFHAVDHLLSTLAATHGPEIARSIERSIERLLARDEAAAAAWQKLQRVSASQELIWGAHSEPGWAPDAGVRLDHPSLAAADRDWIAAADRVGKPATAEAWAAEALAAGLGVPDDDSVRFAVLAACRDLKDERRTLGMSPAARAWWRTHRSQSAGYLYTAVLEQKVQFSSVRLIREDSPNCELAVDPAVDFYRAVSRVMDRVERVAKEIGARAEGLETRRVKKYWTHPKAVAAVVQEAGRVREVCAAALVAVEDPESEAATAARKLLADELLGHMRGLSAPNAGPDELRVAERSFVRHGRVRVAVLDRVLDGMVVSALNPIVDWTFERR